MRWLASIDRALVVLLLVASGRSSAVEIDLDASAGRGFVYATTDVEGQVTPWGLHVGTGYSLVGAGNVLRAGWRALLAYRGERFEAELRSDWAPVEARRGWRSLAPRWSVDLEKDDWEVSMAVVGTLREVDVGLAKERIAAVGQLQVGAELEATYDDRLYLAARASGSFYSVDLHAARYRRADLGLLVTAAGKPEVWLVAGSLGGALTKRLRLTAECGALEYAATHKKAVVPKLEARVGPFAGVTVIAGAELAVVLTEPRQLLPTGSLTMVIER